MEKRPLVSIVINNYNYARFQNDAIFADNIYGARQRLGWTFKTFLVVFAPMRVIWRVYPNARPVAKSGPHDMPANSLAVGK